MTGLAAGPAGAQAFAHEMAGAREGIAGGMASAIPAHQAHMQQMELQERNHLNSQNDRVLATREAQERALEAVELDGPVGTANKTIDSLVKPDEPRSPE
jgi:N-formylglutamate amidohydrolase